MKRYWAYFKYLIRHKYYVFIAGRLLDIPFWQLLMHDMSKFNSEEFGPYARAFYDEDGNTTYVPSEEFDKAWKHHYTNNKHHWEYWVLHDVPTEMRDMYPQELVADLAGTGKVKQGTWEFNEWYKNNSNELNIHFKSKVIIQKSIDMLSTKLKERGYVDAEN